MSRSALLDLLPDFSGGRRHGATPRAPGFEPLVQDAGTREEFSTLGMSSGLPGLSLESEPGGEPDPFGSGVDLMPEIDMGGEPPSLDLADLAPEDPDPLAGLGTEEPIDLMEEPPAEMPEDISPDMGGMEALGSGEEESEDAAAGIAAHELLEAAHRGEINDIEAAHRKEIEEIVSTRIPRVRDEIVDVIAGQLAPLLTTCLREEQVAKTLDALVGAVRVALEDTEALGFELHGPEDLLAAFDEKWSGEDTPAKLVPADGIDLVARIDKTVIATRLSEVDRLFQEALS